MVMFCAGYKLKASPPTNTSVRLISAMLALDLAKNFVSPAMWIYGESRSVIGTVARLATWPEGLALVFCLSAVVVVPYILMQLFSPNMPGRNNWTQWACRGLIMGGVIWIYMAYLSRGLDFAVVTSLFTFNGVMSIVMAGILGYGINQDQIDNEDRANK